jgi:predicted amidophosphoribosyltransferase
MKEIVLKGVFKIGWALDYHTKKSVYKGDVEGLPYFDTDRTELGELIYNLKYTNLPISKKKELTKLLAKRVIEFLKTRIIIQKNYIDVIIPIPPSREREFQHVYEIADLIGKEIGIKVDKDFILKIKKTPEMKNEKAENKRAKLKGSFILRKPNIYEGKNILLFDDIFQTGETANIITELLYKVGNVKNVYLLTLTKTRSK